MPQTLENIHLVAGSFRIRHDKPPIMVKTTPLLDGVILNILLIIFLSGRPGRNRTHNPRFWRAVLCQIELLAYVGAGFHQLLFGLAMQRVLAATRAIFVQLNTPRIITPIFLRGVIALLAIRTCQSDYRANIFFRGHSYPLLYREIFAR
jgi:hypothetical protein